MTTDNHQTIMNGAYDRWNATDATKHWSKQEFWDQLSGLEKVAVFFGNFNQQVCNGGFSQWSPLGNDYGTDEVVNFLIAHCATIDTPAAKTVAGLIAQAHAAWDGIDPMGSNFDDEEDEQAMYDDVDAALSPLDRAYYKINDEFMADVEAYITRLMG